MFIRQIRIRKNGKGHAYWALVESYRTERGPRQRIVSYLGQMDAGGRLGIQYAVVYDFCLISLLLVHVFFFDIYMIHEADFFLYHHPPIFAKISFRNRN